MKRGSEFISDGITSARSAQSAGIVHAQAKWPWSPSRDRNPSEGGIGQREEQESGIAILDPETSEDLHEPGDHERYSHYVLKEKIVESAVTGKSVRALCGKKWIPGRDPEKFPICPICKEIHEGLRKRDEGSSSGGSGDNSGGGGPSA